MVCALIFLALIFLMMVGLICLPFWLRRFVNREIDRAVKLLFTEPYTKSVLEGFNGLRKFGIQITAENELRSSKPEPLSKPIGTHRTFPHFDGLLFSPAPLARPAKDHSCPVSMDTVLGKNAARPLVISMPMMIAAMGYGVALSKPFVRSIAKGAAMANTAMNTGQGPVFPEVRQLTDKMIVQFHGAPWRPSDAVLQTADMIEIRYGQGANAGYGSVIPRNSLTREILTDMGMPEDLEQDLYIPVGIPGVHSLRALRKLVKRLRHIGNGVPIALKLAASHHIENDLEIAIDAGVDVVVLDGAQGGTQSAPGILVDDFGLPTLSALCRSIQFLKQNRLRNKIDVVVSGGIRTPGDVLKALALGADAVYMGTAALFAATHTQLTKAIPFEPPTQLAWAEGDLHHQYDEEKGAQSLANFLLSCSEEIKIGVRALGKTSVHDVTEEDLVAYDREVARITGRPLI
jgi:glutamate synthase domain-containing protein 2